jgi:hypothetical protein
MAQRTRLVVTGHNGQKKSQFITDGDAPNVRVFKHYGGTAVTDLWMTTSMPVDNSRIEDVGTREFAIEPPPGGTIFRVIEYPPDKIRLVISTGKRPSVKWGLPTPWLKKGHDIPGCIGRIH